VLAFVARCDWLQQLGLMNIFQHVRFCSNVLHSVVTLLPVNFVIFLLQTSLHEKSIYIVADGPCMYKKSFFSSTGIRRRLKVF